MDSANQNSKYKVNKIVLMLLDNIVLIILLILILALALMTDKFMTAVNWLNILKAVALKGVIAFGMTMVIICGQIDLSIGSVVAISGVIAAWCAQNLPAMLGITVDWAAIIGIIAALLFAVLMGVFHAYSHVKFGMPAFIITLATQLFLFGLAGLICGGYPIAGKMPAWFNNFGFGRIGAVPIPAIVLVIFFLISWFIMDFTSMGRSIYAVGGNPEAARLSGINVLKTQIFSFSATAVLAAISGFMVSGQVMQASFTFGKGWETDVISSVVIGGTSMNGGIGKITGTMLGVIFIGVISNGMTLMNVSVYMQYVIRSVLLFGAVLISIYLPKMKQKLS